MGWDHRYIVGPALCLFYLTLFDGGRGAKISDGVYHVACAKCEVAPTYVTRSRLGKGSSYRKLMSDLSKGKISFCVRSPGLGGVDCRVQVGTAPATSPMSVHLVLLLLELKAWSLL